MLVVTEKALKSHRDATACYICEKDSHNSLLKIKIIEKVGTIANLQVISEVQT